MAHRLDVVAVGIEDECRVIIGVIVRPQAGSAIVSPAGPKCGNVESVDTRAVGRGDGDVQGLMKSAFAADPEVRLAGPAEACCGSPAFRLRTVHFHHKLITEWRKRLRVEVFRTRVVRNRKADMIDHEDNSRLSKENSLFLR